MTMPKWLKLEYVGLLLLGTSAAININIVVHDHAEWLHAGLAGASLAWMTSASVIGAMSRMLREQIKMQRQTAEAMDALLFLKGREIGRALSTRLGFEDDGPPVTRH